MGQQRRIVGCKWFQVHAAVFQEVGSLDRVEERVLDGLKESDQLEDILYST